MIFSDDSGSLKYFIIKIIIYEVTFSESSHVFNLNRRVVGLDGLGVTCLPRDPRFTGSNPAEVDGFCHAKILSRILREGL